MAFSSTVGKQPSRATTRRQTRRPIASITDPLLSTISGPEVLEATTLARPQNPWVARAFERTALGAGIVTRPLAGYRPRRSVSGAMAIRAPKVGLPTDRARSGRRAKSHAYGQHSAVGRSSRSTRS